MTSQQQTSKQPVKNPPLVEATEKDVSREKNETGVDQNKPRFGGGQDNAARNRLI